MRLLYDKEIRYLWPLLLPILFIAMGGNRFPYPGWGSAYSDITVTHYPNAYYLKEAVNKGEIPLWSPAILSGYPFAANPLSGLWYPPGWLALLFPLPLGFNLVTALHIFWGGYGMYRFLRENGLGQKASTFGALALALMPKWIGHYGAGHISLVYAFSWTPWLLSATKKRVQRHSKFGEINPYPPLIMALIFLADVRWAAYAGVLWLAFEVAQWKNISHVLVSLLLQSILITLCIMPLLLLLVEFTRLSTRSALMSEDLFIFSLPLMRLLGLIYPNFSCFPEPEWVAYPGVLTLCLSLYGTLMAFREKRFNFWLGVGVFGLVVATGLLRPLSSLLIKIPGVAWLRVPSRALFLTDLALVVISTLALETLLKKNDDDNRQLAQKIWMALSSFSVFLAIGSWILTRRFILEFVWGAGAVILVTLWLILGIHGLFAHRPFVWYWGLVGLCLVDLGFVDYSLLSFRPADEVFQQGKAAAQWLAQQSGLFRVYSPSYSIPQHTAMRWGLQLADGIDPLQLKSYVSFMKWASGVPFTGYSVTLPPLEGNDPTQANASYKPDPRLLGLLNVRYVVSEFDLNVDGLVLRQRFGQTRIYENEAFLPRAWVQPADKPLGSRITSAPILLWTPERIVLQADGPGLLVLSEVMYPGWQVWVDGRRTQIETVGGLFRGVTLPTGYHQVEFAFYPSSIYWGLALGVLGWLITLWLIYKYKYKHKYR